ncbi:hypothetical protein ACHAPD_000510 [Fusarium lateritium]
MVSRSILAVAAAAMFLGAEAGPCRPTTATSLADSETSSIVLPVSESTTLTTLIETTPTAVAETTSTVLDEVTPTTLAASTTTSEAPNCVETQVVSNPGFDDNNDLSPWTSSGSLTDNGAHSAPNAVCTIQPKIGSDALPAANPYERSGWNSESETWSSGGTSVVGVAISFKIDCSGEYDDLTILLDDVTLTRDCNGAIRGD